MIDPNKQNVILCGGMVRSGSTLQFNLICALLEASGHDYVAHSMTASEFAALSPDKQGVEQGIVILKTHDTDTSALSGEGYHIMTAYTYRDLRDVYLSGKEKCGWNSIAILCEQLDRALAHYELVRNRTDKNVIMQPYEHFYQDIAGSTKELAQFLGLKVDEETVQDIAEKCSIGRVSEIIGSNPQLRKFMRMKRWGRLVPQSVKTQMKEYSAVRSVLKWLKGSRIDEKTMFHADHISQRKGKPGLWKDFLSDQEVRTIEERYRPFLVQNGYLEPTE